MILTTQNTAFIEAQQYSDFILENMHDGLLPGDFYRDVSDFGDGETLNIKTIGEAQIQEVEEDVAITYSPIETGTVQLTITDYVGDGWYVTDKMRQDGSQIDQLLAVRGKEATRAIQEHFETRAFAVLNAAQTAGNANNINGFAHRVGATGTNQTLTLADLIRMRLAFNKAEVPMAGRVGFVDPVVEATLNLTFNITSGTGDLAANAVWQSIAEQGFAREHNFVINLYGWNIMTSNRLPEIASETVGAVTVTTGVANIFMCIADDHCKPLMAAWRQMPRVEGERNKDKQRDEFVQTARWGLGVQRVDTLGVILTDATAIS
jgi:hypothetical protein